MSDVLRELSVGVRQYRRIFELTLEQSVERYRYHADISRRERILTVTAGGYKTI